MTYPSPNLANNHANNLANTLTYNFTANLTNNINNLTTHDSDEEEHHSVCDAWLGVNDVLYQLANICMGVSFLAPNNYVYQLLFLRCIICLGCMFFILWAMLVSCLWDFLTWNLLVMGINVLHIVYMSYTMYPVSFDPALDKLFTALTPYQIPRLDFKLLVDSGHLESIDQDTDYAVEGNTRCREKLSILITGR